MTEHRTHNPATHPRVERAERRAETARELTRAMLNAHAVGTLVAGRIGVSEARLRQWQDPHDPASISYADALALPPDVLRPLLELAASRVDGFVGDLPKLEESAETHLTEGIVAVQRAMTDACEAAMRATSKSDAHRGRDLVRTAYAALVALDRYFERIETQPNGRHLEKIKG